MKIKYTYIILICFFISNTISGQCTGNNTFTGATSSSWNAASNWTEGCVPVSPITGFISIEANCVLSGSASYTFDNGSTFQIKAGITFTNSSSGAWTMNGTTRGGGTYIGNETIDGPIKPGYATPPTGTTGSITHDGQTYATKLMPDGKWWMTENLNIGTMITGFTTMTDNSIIEKYCYNNNASNCSTYGGLYQWNEMMQYTTTQGAQGICPTGWHLPTDGEWTALEAALPSPDKASRLAGNEPLWFNGPLDQSPYFGTSGFASLPAGVRGTDGYFYNQPYDAYYWSSTEDNTSSAWIRYMDLSYTDIFQSVSDKAPGFSVRCVQD